MRAAPDFTRSRPGSVTGGPFGEDRHGRALAPTPDGRRRRPTRCCSRCRRRRCGTPGARRRARGTAGQRRRSTALPWRGTVAAGRARRQRRPGRRIRCRDSRRSSTGRSVGSRSRRATSTDRWNPSTSPCASRPIVRSPNRRNIRGACSGSTAPTAWSTQASATNAVRTCQNACGWSQASGSHVGLSTDPRTHVATATAHSTSSGTDQTPASRRRRATSDAATMVATAMATIAFVAPGAVAHRTAAPTTPIAIPASEPRSAASNRRPTCHPATNPSAPMSGTSWRNWEASLAAPW